jgi:hypothetical protein
MAGITGSIGTIGNSWRIQKRKCKDMSKFLVNGKTKTPLSERQGCLVDWRTSLREHEAVGRRSDVALAPRRSLYHRTAGTGAIC